MSPSLRQQRSRDAERAGEGPLLAALDAHDVGAIEEIYDRHAGLLYSLALLIGANPEVAKHVVEDTFITLWRLPSGIDLERQSLRASLVQDVRTRCARLTA